MKHLILIKVKTADPRVALKFPFVSTFNKRYISKPENKENGSVSGKTDSPVSFLFSVFLAEFPSGAQVLTKPANFALASKIHVRGSPRRGTLHYSSGCRWPTKMVQTPCLGGLMVFHVNQVIQHLFLH